MSVERSPAGEAFASAPSAGTPAVTFASAYMRREDVPRAAETPSSGPGRAAMLLAALLVGLLLMGMQLWLLTVALDLYLGGQGRQIWLLAVVSGLIFVGGVVMLMVLGRRPRIGGR